MRSAFLAGALTGIVLVVLIIIAEVVAASPYPEVHTITVAEGDTLAELMADAPGGWTRAAWINGLTTPDVLEVGDRLVVPLTPGRSYVPPAPRRPPVAASRSAGGYEGAERPTGDVAAILACIRRWESGGDYNAVSSNGLWFGAYQFDVGTYQSVASGHPADASPAEQDAAAAALYESRGLQPWPTPAVMC